VGAFTKGRAMANDRSMERLERLKETPLYKVGDSGIDWFNEPIRSEVADQMTWLGWTKHDAPIRKAFEFFGLDPADPRHWRVLIEYLAMSFFPNAKKDGKNSLKTTIANTELLKRANDIRDRIFRDERRRLRDSELLKLVVKAYPKDYSKGKIPNLRKRLNVARKAEGYFLEGYLRK
jgi:hypothetical protein